MTETDELAVSENPSLPPPPVMAGSGSHNPQFVTRPPSFGHYQPVTPWSAWGGVGAVLIIALLVFGLLAGAMGLLAAIDPKSIERVSGGIRVRFEMPQTAYAFSVIMLASQAFGVALTVLFARRYGGRVADVLALHTPQSGFRAYAWAVPAFVVFGFTVGAIVQWLSPQTNQADTEPMMQLARSPAAWLIFVAAAVMAPLQEELVFRGFLFSALARARLLGFAGAALLTSAGWAAIHGYSITGDGTIFLLGLALSFILWRTGSTRVTMACHGCYNALAFLAAAYAGASGS